MATKIKTVDMSIKPEDMKKSKETEVTVVTSDKKAAPKVRKEKKSPDRRPSHHRGHGKASNWVCIQKGDEVLRVERETVDTKYLKAGWSYCSRTTWRQKARGTTATPVASVSSKKPKKSKVSQESSEA